MKKYIAHFAVTETNKIQLIKMIRIATNIGLRDAKEFVEQHVIPSDVILFNHFSLLMTELQLGRLYIDQAIGNKSDFTANSGFYLSHVEEVPEPSYIDVSGM